ncbi:MAG: cardiolipin synthase ClsB [Phycisphaerae bacterium]|nr:cardiolipin synthase ClsB [Phycisphaerae bacterium]
MDIRDQSTHILHSPVEATCEIAGPWTNIPRPTPVIDLPEHLVVSRLTFEEISRYVRKFKRFQLADEARLLIDGRETYPEMLASIESAKDALDFETYTFNPDQTGETFQQALCQAADRGVRVRLLYDYIGSRNMTDAFLRPMIDRGIQIRVYHPLVLHRPIWVMNRRDHRKILIIDGRTTFTGGINISDEYAPIDQGGLGWRDTHIRIEGEAVAMWADQLFEYAWQKSTAYHEVSTSTSKLRAGLRKGFRKPLTLGNIPVDKNILPTFLSQSGKVPVRIIGNRELRFRRRIRSAYLYAINNARKYILIENAYFIPDYHIRMALALAVRRGVQVAVLVAKDGDVPLAADASRSLYTRLLRSGVRIFEWPDGMMHAKTAVIDDVWSIVGSYNLDHRSLLHQLEAVALVVDSNFSYRLRQQTLADLACCRELTLERHQARPWHWKLREALAYKIRYWL